VNINLFKQVIEFNELSYQPKSHFVKSIFNLYKKNNLNLP